MPQKPILLNLVLTHRSVYHEFMVAEVGSWRSTALMLLAVAGFAFGTGIVQAADAINSTASVTRLLVTLMRSPNVQTDLKLDARQRAAVDAAIAEVDQPLWRLREVLIEKSADAVKELQSKIEGKLHATLTPEQRHRVEQLLWRTKGIWALKDARFIDRFELTATQKNQVTELLGSIDRSKASAAKVAEIEKQIEALFTEPQRQKVHDLLGPAFDLSRVRQVAVSAPEIAGIEGWVNSPPLRLADLRGKVVVLHFWAFGCINCVHNLPIYKTWQEELPHDKVAIIGIHTPETAEEHKFAGLQQAAKERGLAFPIAMDLKGETWKAWGNSVWPAVYLIDRRGDVRYWWSGELKWNGAEGDKLMRERIEQLVVERD